MRGPSKTRVKRAVEPPMSLECANATTGPLTSFFMKPLMANPALKTALFYRPSGLRSEATRALSRWDSHSKWASEAYR
jgi:hypothetical protein